MGTQILIFIAVLLIYVGAIKLAHEGDISYYSFYERPTVRKCRNND